VGDGGVGFAEGSGEGAGGSVCATIFIAGKRETRNKIDNRWKKIRGFIRVELKRNAAGETRKLQASSCALSPRRAAASGSEELRSTARATTCLPAAQLIP